MYSKKHHLTKEEQKTVLKFIQKATGKKQPRRYLFKMFDMCCLYFCIYEDRPKQFLKEYIDKYFEY